MRATEFCSMSLLCSTRLAALCSQPAAFYARHAPVVALDVEDLLTRCDGSAEKLAKLLTKPELKEECEKRSLPVSGTKVQLAPRLLDALRAELALSPAYASGVPIPQKPPPSPPPVVQAPAATSTVTRPPQRRTAQDAPPLPSGAAPVESTPTPASTPALPKYDASGMLIDIGSSADGRTGTGADFELTVLGSGACSPSPWRGASCTAIRVRDSFWLFDVGEATQVQLQKSAVRPSKIDKIFITHAHGDHCFGLPGLLCLIARGRDRGAKPLEIYGPAGLRAFVRATLAFTGTRMLPPFVVHELHDVPMLRRSRGDFDQPPDAAQQMLVPVVGGQSRDGAWGEVPGGRDIRPEDGGSWWSLLYDEEDASRNARCARARGAPHRGFDSTGSGLTLNLRSRLLVVRHACVVSVLPRESV